MSRLTSLFLWGRFFKLSSTLKYNSSNGYQITSSHRTRHPVNRKYYRYFQENIPDGIVLSSATDEYNDFVKESKFFISESVDHKFFNKVETELKKKIQVWDFEFDRFTSIDSKSFKQKKINLQSFLHKSEVRNKFKSLNVSQDALATSLLNNPIIGDDFGTLKVNSIIIDQYINKIALNLNPQAKVLVLTGEMVWSSFMHISHITKLIQEKINRDIDIILDLQGIWRSMIYLGGTNKEILKFSGKYFTPDIRFIASLKNLSKSKGYRVFKYYKKRALHQIVLIKNRVVLYDIGAEVYEKSSKNKLPPIILFKEYSKKVYFKLNENRFLNWWRTPKHYTKSISSIVLNFYPFSTHIEKVFKLEQPKNFSNKKHSNILKGQVIGKVQQVEYNILDYHRYGDIADYITCINGQIVKKGDVLAKIPKLAGFITSVIKATVNGRVGLDMVNDGYIKIFRNKHWENKYADFDGRVVDIRKDKYFEVATKAIVIFSTNYIPNDIIGGILRTSKERIDAKMKNILMLKDLREFHYSADQIRDLNIAGVICATATYKDYYNFVTDHNVKVSGIALLMMSRFNETSSDSYEKLKQYLEYYIFIDDGVISIPTKQFGSFLQSPALADDPQYKPMEWSLGKGQQVKYLTYDSEIHYAIIENIQNNLALVNQSDKLFSVDINNIIITKNE